MNSLYYNLKKFLPAIIIIFTIFLAFGADLDNDGMNDAWEASMGLNNSSASDAAYDNDSDSLTNLWEYKLGFDPFDNNSDSNYTIANESQNAILDAFEDLDNDGLNNSFEISINTSALNNDTDNDNLLDGQEILIYNTNATNNDTDNDNILDGQEILIYYSNPLSNDTDFDKKDDYNEIINNRNPTLGIQQSQNKYNLTIGDAISYSFNITSTNKTSNATLSCILPNGLVYFNSSSNASFIPNIQNQNISYSLGNLSGFTQYQFNITAYLNNTPNNNYSTTILPAQFIIYYQNETGSSKQENESSSAINIYEPNSNITITTNTSYAKIGSTINITITINKSQAIAHNYTINTYLGDGLNYLSSNIIPSQINNNNLTFKFANSTALQNISILTIVNSTYKNSKNVLAKDTIYTKANLTYYSTKNLTLARKYSSQTTNTTIQLLSPTISISTSQNNITIGQIINYTIIYNFTNAPANLVQSNITIPQNHQYLNYSSSAPLNFSNLGNILNFNFNNLTSAQIVTLNISYILNNSANANDVFSSQTNLIYSSTNTSQYLINNNINGIYAAEPSLTITKSIFSPVSVSDILTYIITITNNGNSSSYNTTLIETIANGTKLISTSPIYDIKSGSNNQTIQFNLNPIPPQTTKTVNITVNVTNQYFDNSYVLANDTLDFTTNLTYQSVKNYSLARKYQTSNLETTTIQEGAITKQTNGTITINSNPTTRIGEEFIYELIINFSGAPANSVYIEDKLPQNMTFISTNNTLNSSVFSKSGQLLSWNFGNLTPTTKIIYINISVYFNDSTSNYASNSFINTANLTYSNSIGSSILKQDSTTIYIAEPNLNITKTLINTNDISINSLVNYTINITNNARPLNIYNSKAYNITLTDYIPNGLILNYSSSSPNFINNTHIIYNIGDLDVNQTQIINLTFKVNQTYKNGSYVLSEDTFSNYADIIGYSYNILNRSRNYTKNSTSQIIKTASPTINITNNATSFSIGDIINYKIILNFSNAPANNINITNNIPFGFEIINYSSTSNISFSQNANTLIWNYGNLTSTNIFQINVSVLINDSLTQGDSLTYNISLSYTSTNNSQYTITNNNTITIREPTILINENIFSPVSVSDILTYIINLTNIGNSPSYNTTFVHTIPNGTTLISTSPLYNNNSGTYNQTYKFNIGQILNGTSTQINFTVNVTDKYYNNNFILANDTLYTYSNISYQSTNDYNNARFYFNNSNATTTVQEGAIVKDTIGTIIINSSQAVRIGEIYNYTILVNFTGAPANTVYVADNLPQYVTFVSQNNSYNNSLFTNLGSGKLEWNFGDLTPTTKIIKINLSVYIENSSSYIAKNIITNNVNLTYQNTYGSSILKQDSSDIEIVEPKLQLINTLINSNDIIVGNLINYTINLTNIENQLLNYYSECYNISLIQYIPNGLILNYSSLVPNSSNTTHIIWNLNSLNRNQTQIINLTFKVNQTYKNKNNILAEDVFLSNISAYSQSINNYNKSRKYFIYNTSVQIKIKSPNISISLNESNLRIGQKLKANIILNFSKVLSNSVNTTISIPNGLEYLTSNANNNISFNQYNNQLIWNYGNINISKLYNINITFMTNSSLNQGNTPTINATLNYQSSNNLNYYLTVSDNTTIKEPQLSFYIYDISSKEIGDNITYIINISNVGNSPAYNITLFTKIANGTTVITSNPFQDSQYGTYNNFLEHNLGDLNIGQIKQINITSNIQDNYTDGSSISTGDILFGFFNTTYYSHNNLSIAKRYINYSNKSFSISSPELTVKTNTTLTANNISIIRIGELFEYNLIVNFTDRYSTKAYIQNILPNNLTFISQRNSLNNSAFANISNTLMWNFTNLNSSTKIIYINVTAIASNTSSNTFGTILQSNYNLTYENSLLQEIGKTMYYNLGIAEPNININMSTNTNVISLNDLINYTIIISNNKHLSNFTSDAYKLNLTSYLGDGLTYINSNYPLSSPDTYNLSFSFSNLNVNNNITINIIVLANNTLQNGSQNDLKNLTNNIKLKYYSYPNTTNARKYLNQTSINVSTHDITKPIINSYSITPIGVATSQNITLLMNATDEFKLDSCYVNILYPNSTSINLSNACTKINFTTPNLIGKYNVTFYANDTSNNIQSITNLSFKVGPPLIFNTTVINDNLSGLNASINIYINNTKILTNNNPVGNFTNTISTFIYDILYSTYNDTFKVRLNTINATSQNNKQIGFYKNTNTTGSLAIFGVLNDGYNFTTASINISYSNLNYNNENNLKIQVCENWNFTAHVCYSSWNDIIGATQNTVLNNFNFVRNKFSSFRIIEVIPPSSGGGGSSSGSSSGSNTNMNFTIQKESTKCLEDWICIDWESCINGSQSRKCFDNNDCGTFFDIPNRTQICNINKSEKISNQNTSVVQKVFEKPIKTIKTSSTYFEKIIKSKITLVIIYFLLIFTSFSLKSRIDKKYHKDIIYSKKHILKYYGEHYQKELNQMFIIGLLVVFTTSSIFVLISGLYIGLVFGIFCEIVYIFFLHNHFNNH